MPVSVHHPKYNALQSALATFRKDAGLSQIQMAERLGVGQTYISKIERAETYDDIFVFVDWCCACGLKPGIALDYLVDSIKP